MAALREAPGHQVRLCINASLRKCNNACMHSFVSSTTALVLLGPITSLHVERGSDVADDTKPCLRAAAHADLLRCAATPDAPAPRGARPRARMFILNGAATVHLECGKESHQHSALHCLGTFTNDGHVISNVCKNASR